METSVHVRVQSSVMGSDRQEEWCWRDRRSGVVQCGVGGVAWTAQHSEVKYSTGGRRIRCP